MATKRVMAALLAAPLGALLLGALPANASPDPKLSVSDVQLSKTAVSVSGLAVTKVDVTVKAGYNSDDPQDENTVLTVYLDRTAGSGIDSIGTVALKRTAGTLKNGTWTGVLNVGSAANGTFKVTGVGDGVYGDMGGGMPDDPTAFDGPSLAVTGTHIPKVSHVQTPAVVPAGKPYSIKWMVTDTATGKPYGTPVPLELGNGFSCQETATHGVTVKTDAAGNYIEKFTAAEQGDDICGSIRVDPYPTTADRFYAKRSGVLSAVPSKTSAKVGTNVPVNGTLTGYATGCRVYLQKLRGASQWRDVGSALVRSSGRFTLTATPAVKGKIYYRAHLPEGCGGYIELISKTFTITGL
ncbi:hypothetical protein ACFTSF_00660 [Kribbella sp. NPDC056951]|uniref:hypothetical protein n=1 Tax=Kribbella sp. NPDC056951 TaxID=3345978 RepID=UPI003632F527